MSEDTSPYIEQSPGDLITAENWNELQRRIKADICDKVDEGVAGIEKVPLAGDSEKLEGKTADELTDELIERALAELRARSGYIQAFRILKTDEVNEIDHNLGVCPLVDVYQLEYFPVVCCEHDEIFPAWATFYLYHTSETNIRYPKGETSWNVDLTYPKGSIDIESRKDPVYKIPFAEMLKRYKVEYNPQSDLGNLETEFWEAFFAEPNERFDDKQFCHSPWFEKCCREDKTVKEIKRKGHWDDLWFLVKPRKTINYPGASPATMVPDTVNWTLTTRKPEPPPAPTQVQVCQYDFTKVGLQLLADPVYHPDQLKEFTAANPPKDQPPGSIVQQLGGEVKTELKVMVLLKC